MPPAKSRYRLPSTSSMVAPSARAAKTGVAFEGPRGMAASRRAIKARDFGPGISVRIWIVFICVFLLPAARKLPYRFLVPADRGLVEIDEHLLGFEIFFEAPGTQLATEAGLLVASPGSFDVRWLHVIDPDDAGAQGLYDAESFVNVAGPDRRRKSVRRVVGDANGIWFAFEGNHGSDGAEDFFAGDASRVIDVVENCRLHVEALAKLLRVPAADGHFRFLLAEFEVRADAVVLFFADQRAHFRFAIQRCAQLDALGFFRHGVDEFRINSLLDEDAAAGGANFSLVDEDSEKRAVNGGFPIGAIEEDVGRLAAELESDALEGVRGAFDYNFSDGGAARECNLIHSGMSDERGSCGFTKAVDNVDDAGRQAQFFEPVGDFHHGKRRLLGRLEDAGAARGDGGSELPGSHHQRIVPGNDLSGDANGFAKGKTQCICRNGIDVAQNFVREAGVIFETGRDVGDVVFCFHDGLAGIAAFQLSERRGVGANFFRQFVEKATAVGGAGLTPRAGIKRGARGFHGVIDIRCGARRNVRDHFFGGGIVDGKHLAGRTLDPPPIDVVLIGSNDRFHAAGHNCLPNSVHNTGAGAAANFRAALRLP